MKEVGVEKGQALSTPLGPGAIMQGMWAVSTGSRAFAYPRNWAVLPGAPGRAPASQQLLRHCRRVGLVAGTALGTGKCLRGRPLLQAWGKVARVAGGPQAGVSVVKSW